MTVDDLIGQLESEAQSLLTMSKGFRSKCNESHKSGMVGKAVGLMAAAEKLRQYQATTTGNTDVQDAQYS